MIHVTSVRPDQMGQALTPAPARTVPARICILRTAGQSDAAITSMLVKEFPNLTQDELSTAFIAANTVCPAGVVSLVPTPSVVPGTTTPPMMPPMVPIVCPEPPKHLPWWVWALIGFGTATAFGLIIYAVARKSK